MCGAVLCGVMWSSVAVMCAPVMSHAKDWYGVGGGGAAGVGVVHILWCAVFKILFPHVSDIEKSGRV